MSKRKRSAKRSAEKVQPALTPTEQLQLALEELKESAAFFVETAISEAQSSASALLEELKTRTATWVAIIKDQTARISQKGRSAIGDNHRPAAANPALS
jgi:FtsZ-binding cell division protein ZapB